MVGEKGESQTITIRVAFEGGADDIAASAYLFDRAGELLASAPVSKGQARLSVDRVPRGARLFIGPSLDKTERVGKPSFSTMERLSAFDTQWRFEPGREVYELPPIPELIWPHWPLCRCRVRGRVVVRRTSPGGVVVEAPVCEARVHICEVDRLPWLILRLPDPEIFRLRDDLFDLIRYPIPRPPIPDPGPLEEVDFRLSPERATLRKRLQEQVTRVIGNGVEEVALNPQPLPPEPPPELAAFSLRSANVDTTQGLPVAARYALASQSAAVVRRALVDHIELIRPWLCYWPWLHRWFYRCDELRVVTTGSDGRFDTSIWYPCAGDKPDLYFWVEYSIGGVWTTVYHPPIACHVWWDYVCGTDVTITVTDPRVPGCGERPDVPGKVVIVKTIARQVSMGEINREPSPVNPGADPAKAGTVKPGWIDAVRESPFGAILEPRVDFGDGLKPAGITHYRWSYRVLGSTSDADWAIIDAPVSRHYRETTPPGDPVVYKSVQIGPATGVTGYFVEIDPALPAGGEDWEILDEGYDLASAHWNTDALAPGKYELKLELFRLVGGTMTRVDLTAEGVGLHQILDPAPLTAGTYVTSPATHDRALLDPGTGNVLGYRLVLHADNRPCFGTIEPVSVAPGANDTKCGFLEYAAGATATISFRASHPAHYASFDFTVSRVATVLPSASASGLVDDGAVNGFSRAGDLFTKGVSVTALLSEGLLPGVTPCTRAAFAESLYVSALATNGYGRLSGLDAPRPGTGQVGLRAFAITPA